MMKSFIAEQREINERVQGRQDGFIQYMEAQSSASGSSAVEPGVTVEDEDEDIKQEDERQRYRVRNSRASLTLNNSSNVNNVYSPSSITFAPPPLTQRTLEEQARRASQGLLFTPQPSTKTAKPNPNITPSKSAFPKPLDKDRHSMYDKVSSLLSKRDKWYGDRKHDKGLDVFAFVRAVEHTMDMWMKGEPRGRLDLVIDCTAGPAQQWLLTRKVDCDRMIAEDNVKPENADWDTVKGQFIVYMGGGQSQRLYQTQLENLLIEKGSDSQVVADFISKFDELATRAYPLDEHPDTTMRGLMLGKEFSQRVAASDTAVWSECMRSKPPPRTLWDWKEALTSAWATEHTIREQRKKQGFYRGNKVDVPSVPAVRVNNMEAESETGEVRSEDTHDGREEGTTALNVAAAKVNKASKASVGEKKPRNKFLNGSTLARLLKLSKCLQCYKAGHIARNCTAQSATRAPTDAELN